ncbi:MAG TPA: hypothetical protein VHS99_25710 [Chloroflexota bacterium]|nr:hypothetical protein [Chloroflexota bacterium]
MGLLDRLFGRTKEAPVRGAAVTYRVGINETCRTLARRFYGEEGRWERIYQDNERVLGSEVQTSTDPILPGTEVTIRDAAFDLDGNPIDGVPGNAARQV